MTAIGKLAAAISAEVESEMKPSDLDKDIILARLRYCGKMSRMTSIEDATRLRLSTPPEHRSAECADVEILMAMYLELKTKWGLFQRVCLPREATSSDIETEGGHSEMTCPTSCTSQFCGNGGKMTFELYHCTTPRKLQRYESSRAILKPVRGFRTIEAALYWCRRANRSIILKISEERSRCHKLPDHHTPHGEAWWIDADVNKWEIVKGQGSK